MGETKKAIILHDRGIALFTTEITYVDKVTDMLQYIMVMTGGKFYVASIG